MATKDREKRLINNEAVFRNWNENVHGRKDMQNKTGSAQFICECSDEDCAQGMTMKNQDYSNVHAKRDHFVVVPGHEIGDIEQVVLRRPGYNVVKKKHTPPEDAALLKQTDVSNA